MLSPNCVPLTILSSTPKSVVTPQEIKADLRLRLEEHDLSFTLELLADIAESVQADCEDESESWTLDSWMIRSIIPHILH
jgi:hypothetical protein